MQQDNIILSERNGAMRKILVVPKNDEEHQKANKHKALQCRTRKTQRCVVKKL